MRDNAVMRELAQQRDRQRRDENTQVFNALRAFEEVTLTALRVAMNLGPHRESWLKVRLERLVRAGAATSRIDDDGRRRYRALQRSL